MLNINVEEITSCNVAKDANKIKIISQKFDSHCFHSARYFRDEVEALVGETNDGSIEWNRKFKKLTKSIPRLNELRTASKGVSLTTKY